MISLTINNQEVEVRPGVSILDASKTAGHYIPRFCYHETLSIAGNCRMCLVEVEGIEKPVASCLTEVSDKMVVYTDSAFAVKARENVLETILLNHPLDCPICDQAGECDLQDQTKQFGSSFSKFFSKKRGVEDKDTGPLIKTIMTRCIHCTRCVRFGSEVAGVDFLGTFNRGSSTEIGGYSFNFFDSEISGNVVDLCPVGALTSKPYAYQTRPWELRSSETIDMTDSMGSSVYVHYKDNEIFRVIPKSNKNINGQIISDTARFSYDANFYDRLEHVFCYKPALDGYRSVNWTKFFRLIDTYNVQENTSFNISENLGLESMYILTQLSRSNKNVNVNSLVGNTEYINFYSWCLTDKINSIDSSDSIGLVFSVNPKIECSVVNARIRIRTQNSLLSLVSMNLYFSSNISTKCVNLSLSKSLEIIEGKSFDYAKNFVSAEVPLVLIGESLKKRGLNLISVISYLKNNFDSVVVLKINASANSESLHLLNIKNVSTRSLMSSKNLMCLDLDDTFEVRKAVFSQKKNVFWFDTHLTKFKQKVEAKIPILSEYEEERTVLNLEQRPQITTKVFTKSFDARSVQKLLKAIYSETLNIKSNTSGSLAYIYAIAKNPFLFDNLTTQFTLLNYKLAVGFNMINFIYKYPAKYNVNSFYSSSKTVKHSFIMQRALKFFNNFDINFR